MKTPFAIAALAALSIGLAPLAVAQESTAGPASLSEVTPAEGMTNDTIDDAKIRSFIEALAAIQLVGNHYTTRIENETDGSKRAELIDLANSDIVRAVETIKNITPAEYVAIDKAAQADPALNERVLAALEVAKKESAENQDELDRQIEEAEKLEEQKKATE